MRIEDLAKKYSRSIPGYEIVHFSEVAFPVWVTNLLLLVLQETPLTVVEEFILKLVGVEVGTIDEISEILGIDNEIVRTSAIRLMKGEVLRYQQKNQTLHLTSKGKEILETLKKMIVPEQRSFSFYVDAITGRYSANSQNLIKPAYVKKQHIRSLFPSKSVEKPSEENIDVKALDELIQEMNKKGMMKGSLLDIQKLEKVYTMYKIMRVLVFHDYRTSKYQYMVFEGDHHANEYDGILLSLDIEEQLGVLPLESIVNFIEKPITDKIAASLEDEATRNLEELERVESKLDQITQESKMKGNKDEEIWALEKNLYGLKKTTRFLRRFEFRSILEEGLETSRQWLVILEPYLSLEIYDDDMLARIDKTLQRGIKILLLYGGDTYTAEKSRVEKDILTALKKVSEKKHGKHLYIKKTDATKEKALVCDKKFMVIGRYSWLESDTFAKKGLRLENHIYTEEQQKILATLQEIKAFAKLGHEFGWLDIEEKEKEVSVFFSYSHKDEAMRNELEKHLVILKRKGVINTWHDKMIDAGSPIDSEINEQLKKADIILLLVSSDFLASNYCYDIEVKEALERHSRNEAVVIPIILRACLWKEAPFEGLKALPDDGKPVASWSDKDEAFLNIAKEIQATAEKIKNKR